MLSRLIETVAGDTLSFRIILTDGASPVDVSGMTFSGGVRLKGASENSQDFSIETTSEAGTIRVSLTPDQTQALADGKDASYEWYVRVQHGDYVRTLRHGALKVVSL